MLPANERRTALSFPQTPTSVKAWFIGNGICISGWAQVHGFDRMTITDLLRGKRVGNYGKGHRAAVALGIKPPPDH